MNYKLVYKSSLPKWLGGRCKYPIFNFPFNLFGFGKCTIEIKHKYKGDAGLLKHELKHAEQFKNNNFHIIRYTFCEDYRLKCELEAYAEQINEYKYTTVKQCDWIIKALSEKYDLFIPKSTIEKEILKILNGVKRV